MTTKILHCITGLKKDGAQRMLQRLTAALDRERFQSRVVSLAGEEPFAEEFRQAGVPVDSIGLQGAGAPKASLRLRRIVAEYQPDIIHGWMYHGNLGASLASVLHAGSEKPALLWNVRNSLHNTGGMKGATYAVVRANALLSRHPKAIVYCAEAAADLHERTGFAPTKRIVIGNGFDPVRFRPSEERYVAVRRELGLPDDARIVGIIGRWHPQKCFPLFLRVAARVAREYPDAYFVLIGRGVSEDNEEIAPILTEGGLRGRALFLGERADVPDLLPAFDIYCSSSQNEGFPNVIGEAMTSGVPCVVTDVGASRELVDGIGVVVPPANEAALAGGLSQLLRLSPEELRSVGRRSRQRILERYTLDRIVEQYQALYQRYGRAGDARKAA